MISNEEGKATPSPTMLGKRGENRMINFQCENESYQVIVWAQDDHMYGIKTDGPTFSNIDQICFR